MQASWQNPALDAKIAAAARNLRAADKAVDTATQKANEAAEALKGNFHLGPSWWDKTTVLTLALSLLVFALIVLGLMTFLIIRTERVGPILRAFGVPLIITAAAFLIVTGFSDQQISPVIGLLGTIAGYLLGKTDDRPPPPTKAP